jgi:N-dimethylarginine dimethylaminohydrolase
MLEFDSIISCFKNLGIAVSLIDPTPINDDYWYRYNLMYCRDLFFMTPRGAIMACMANTSRSAETLYAARTLESLGIPLLHTVCGAGRFEGADAVWLNERLVLVGIGNRTNRQGYDQVAEILTGQGVQCIPVPSNQTRTQHLLGTLQIVDRDLALVRDELIDNEVLTLLADHGLSLVRIPENREILTRQAMNIVTVAPRTIIMTAGCPETRSIFEKGGLTVAAEFDLTQLMLGAGGLACATGVVGRG